MKLAVLGDIHGNSDALEAVLAKAKSLGAEHLIILGDIVGYYHDSRKVMDLLAMWPIAAIKGNHEVLLNQARHSESASHAIKLKYGSAHQTALATLTESELTWLDALPSSLLQQFGSMRLCMCHGSPKDIDQYVYPDASEMVFEQCVTPEVDIVLMGHTHHAFTRVHKGSWLLNPGSVGQPRDGGEGAAAWALLDTELRSARLLRTAYDTSRVEKTAAELDPEHPFLISVLQRR